jgi:hypothetical protein
MRTPGESIERLIAAWDGWHRGFPLSAGQRAAWIAEAWSLPAAYRVTQSADRVKARRTARHAARMFRLHHRSRVDV